LSCTYWYLLKCAVIENVSHFSSGFHYLLVSQKYNFLKQYGFLRVVSGAVEVKGLIYNYLFI